jgi:hypothetical protein
MHDVELLPFGPGKTQLWASAAVRAAIADHHKSTQPTGRLLMLLKRYTQNGFRCYEGGKGCPIKYEWDGVYRIGPGDLFRIIGFYENGSRSVFVAIDAFTKRGTELSAAERRRIEAVAKVLSDGTWRKKTNGNHQ